MISPELIEYIDKNKKINKELNKLYIETTSETKFHKELVTIFIELFKFRTSPSEFNKIKVNYQFDLGYLKNIILDKRIIDFGKEIFEFSYEFKPTKTTNKKKKYERIVTG